MDADYARPYVDRHNQIVYLTDSQYVERQKHDPVRKLTERPSGPMLDSALEQVVTPVTQQAPRPVTRAGEAADAFVGNRRRHPVPEVREREPR